MIDPAARERLGQLLGDRVRFDEPLSRSTSLRVGGPADALARADTRDEVARILEICRSYELPITVLGAGFNTLVRDAGLRGLVLRLHGLRSLSRTPEHRLVVEAGVTHSTVTRFCTNEELTGLEFAVGIPGTLGGWVAMNAGTRQFEMRDRLSSIEYLVPDTGGIERIETPDLSFSYRRTHLPEGAIVVGAEFELAPGSKDQIDELTRWNLDQRRATQPVDQLSCGSVFKNPEGDHAGRLIEAAGLKGHRIGGAEISQVHANFIVNVGGASAADVLALIEKAAEEVSLRFSVELEPEVHILGSES